MKQVSDTLFASKGQSFRKVVLIEFPNRGQWTFGFVVGAPGALIERETAGDLITVYVPTAPNPTSGYVLMVRPSEVKEIDITVDDALKFHLSMGVVAPAVRAAPRSALTTRRARRSGLIPSGLRGGAFPFKLAPMQSSLCARFAIAVRRGRVPSFARALANARNR